VGLFAPWFLAGIAAVAVPSTFTCCGINDDPDSVQLVMFSSAHAESIKLAVSATALLSLRTLATVARAGVCDPFIHRTAANRQREIFAAGHRQFFHMRAGTRLADARREALSVLSTRRPRGPRQVMALGSQIQVLTQPSQMGSAARCC